MAQAKISGFIIDAPKALIKTSKGIAHYVTSSQGEISFGGDSLEINGGFSFYNLTELDTKKTLEVKLTDVSFDLDQFALSTGGTRTLAASEFEEFGEPFVIDSGTYKITIPKAIVAGSCKINGFTETVSATPPANTFKVTISGGSTELLFPSTEAGKTVYPAYKYAVAQAEILTTKTTDFPKAGEVTLTFPIYSGDDQIDADIEGWGQFTIFKAKILQTNTIGGSYKTASSFPVTLKGLDPRRPDGAMWRFVYIPKV